MAEDNQTVILSPLADLLVAIVCKRLGLESSLYQILQILGLTPFEKTPISCAVQTVDADANYAKNVNQPRPKFHVSNLLAKRVGCVPTSSCCGSNPRASCSRQAFFRRLRISISCAQTMTTSTSWL